MFKRKTRIVIIILILILYYYNMDFTAVKIVGFISLILNMLYIITEKE